MGYIYPLFMQTNIYTALVSGGFKRRENSLLLKNTTQLFQTHQMLAGCSDGSLLPIISPVCSDMKYFRIICTIKWVCSEQFK